MKKNVMMRLASGLLVAVLLTTCAISGTFAKYVTTGYAEDSARVAKWGVEIVADGSTFGHFYKAADGKVDYSYNAATDSVASSNGEKVIAPGTNGSVAGLTINGVPEVDTKVSFTADVTLANWDADSAYYCPLVVTVTTINNGAAPVVTPIYGMAYGSATEFENAIEAEVLKATAYFEANTAIDDNSLSIAWEWPFEGGMGQDNEKDTDLGNAATAATVAIRVTATVEQVD